MAETLDKRRKEERESRRGREVSKGGRGRSVVSVVSGLLPRLLSGSGR